MKVDFVTPLVFLVLSALAAAPSLATAAAAPHNEDDFVFMWSSTGGGWRSMFSCVGFANVFQRAGLFTQDSSKFQSIATNSGASWFSTQLFYSENFYNLTTMSPSPYHLYNFSLVWMSAYYEMALEAQGYRENLIRDIIASFLPSPQELIGGAITGVVGALTKPQGEDNGDDNNEEEEGEEGEEENNCEGLAGLNCLFGPGPSLLPEEGEEVEEDLDVTATRTTTTRSSSSSSLSEDTGANVSALEPPEETSQTLSTYNAITIMVQMYDLYRQANASWGYFMEEMLDRAAEKYGHPGGELSSIIANAENRISAVKATNLVLQTTISPQSKVRLSSANYNYTETRDTYGDTNLTQQWAYLGNIFGDLDNQDMGVFLGPLNKNLTLNSTLKEVPVFSVGLSSYYLVNDTYEGFQYAAFDSDSSSTLAAYCSPTHFHLNWNHFQAYYMYPNDGFWEYPTDPPLSVMPAQQVGIYNTMAKNMTTTGILRDAFGGGAANVVQAASVSSAFAGPISPAAPAVFAQSLSLIRQQFIKFMEPLTAIIALTAFDLAAQQLYKYVLVDNGAMCSQWPEPCGPNDGYFMDGAFSDNPSVISNIAQYQNSADADLNKTIKLVLTNTNQDFTPNSYDTQQLTQYFETDFNEDIAPGDFVWLPDFVVPYRSPQIFEEYLSEDDVMAAIEPIEGWNHTTAIYKGTTLNNAAFGIRAGQKVEILMINTNENNITTFIGGLKIIEFFIFPLAEMTYKIAADEVLVERVRNFFFGDDEADDDAEEEEEEEEEDIDDELNVSREGPGEAETGAGSLQSGAMSTRLYPFHSYWLTISLPAAVASAQWLY